MNDKAVILIPCYNPNEKIMTKFIKELSSVFKNIVFIDDGCSKKHSKFMEDLANNYSVFKHNVNLGKGRGIKSGINYILNNYPSAKVIVTADCDGQHSVEDIKKCFEASLKNPDSLVLGCRNFNEDNVPFKSRYGNKITRNVLYNFVGGKISDTQTGLRAMSLDLAKKLIDVPGERYEYETNVLIETKKKSIPIEEVTIKTIYINDNETSHFNPVKDSIRIYRLFAYYLIVTLIAYILENIIFTKTFGLIDAFWGVTLFLLISKLVSTLIILLFNKHINIISTIFNFLICSIILLLVSNHVLIVKVVIDIIILLSNIFLINYTTTK